MTSKIIGLISAGALALSLTTPVLAGGSWSFCCQVRPTFNTAVVQSTVEVGANSGQNVQSNVVSAGGFFGGVSRTSITGSNSMVTGPATAGNLSGVVGNTNVGMTTPTVNVATVTSGVVVTANTGINTQANSVTGGMIGGTSVVGGNSLTSGAATAKSGSLIIVNTNWH